MTTPVGTWHDLEAQHPVVGSFNARRILVDGGALIAIDHDGRRHLLVSVADEGQFITDRRSRGLVLVGRSLEVEEEPERLFLDLCCTEASGNDAFDVLISSITEQLAGGVPPATALRTVLERWRRFWGQAPPEGLTTEEVRGLFGELWFLLAWLLPSGVDQLRKWVGPTGARHDFSDQDFSVEAKTTTSVRGHVHWISALDQLDPPESGELLVFSLRVRDEASALNSLPELVQAISQHLADHPEMLGLFEDRLAAARYSPLHEDRYREMRFRIVSERLYRVGAGFPRLSADMISGGLPQGVEGVKYEINLETCTDLILATDPAAFGSYMGLDREPR